MKANKLFLVTVSLALLVFTLDSCTKDTVNEPAPLGPSSIAIMLDVSASPNVIVARLRDRDRESASVKARLTKFDGTPVADRKIYFEVINASGRRMNVGYFDGENSMQTVLTGSDGTAWTRYYGPLKDEVKTDVELYIKATVAWEGTQNIQDTTPIYIIRDTN